jgi:hypothetical protein
MSAQFFLERMGMRSIEAASVAPLFDDITRYTDLATDLITRRGERPGK